MSKFKPTWPVLGDRSTNNAAILMPHLQFEIWEDPESNAFEMSQVTQRGDELRRTIAARSVLRHSFAARFDFEASQMNYDWHGWGRWRPEAEWTERFFTAEEVEAQAEYLRLRNSR